MQKAMVHGTKIILKGKTLNEIRKQLKSMLLHDNKQALTAITPNGTMIHVESFEGQDYIKISSGRFLTIK